MRRVWERVDERIAARQPPAQPVGNNVIFTPKDSRFVKGNANG